MDKFFELSHIQFVFDMFRTAMGGIEWFLLAYLICIAVLFIIGRETLSTAFVYPPFFMLLTIFNPFLIVPLSEVIGLTTRFRRLFWLLPLNLVLAYAFTCICMVEPRFSYLTKPPKHTQQQIRLNLIHRTAAAILCILFIIYFGSSMKPYLQKPENIYKTTDKIIEISRMINEDADVTGTDKAALYSSQQLLELRQYDPSIRSLLRREDLLDWNLEDTSEESVQKVIKSNHRLHILALVSRYGIQIDQEIFLKNAKKCNAYYIIAHYDTELYDYLISAGYEQLGIVEDFEIYRIGLDENNEPVWEQTIS